MKRLSMPRFQMTLCRNETALTEEGKATVRNTVACNYFRKEITEKDQVWDHCDLFLI